MNLCIPWSWNYTCAPDQPVSTSSALELQMWTRFAYVHVLGTGITSVDQISPCLPPQHWNYTCGPDQPVSTFLAVKLQVWTTGSSL